MWAGRWWAARRRVNLHLRPFRNGDEAALRAVFHSSVHVLARRHYSPAQLGAWAPRQYDAAQWRERIRSNQPFIAELDGVIAGYADLQASGYIDHFFVAGAYGGRGVGKALMAHIHQEAASRGIQALFSDVSLAAELFFRKSGFAIQVRQQVDVHGVILANARMRKALAASGAAGSTPFSLERPGPATDHGISAARAGFHYLDKRADA
jgi:putative acetyltransferase